MKQDDIIPILQRLQDPGPLDPNPADAKAKKDFTDLYVKDLHSAQGSDVAMKLALAIQTSRGTQHGYLFSGTIGSGKSTELRRMAQELRSKSNYAVVINAQDYLNPQMPIGIVDLLLAMALAVWEATANELGADVSSGERWNWFKTLFSSGVEITDIEFSSLIKVKASLKSNPTVREQLRKFHEARLDILVSTINEFLVECATKIKSKKGWTDNSKMVLIVDSLEHFGGQAAAGQPDEVFISLQRMFNTFANYLRLDGWSAVYSVPPLLHKLAPGIANAFGATSTNFLTSAHVFKDRSTEVDTATVSNKLIPLVRKRIGEDDVDKLIGEAEIRDIIETTGGDLRDLMRAVRAVLLAGLGDQNTFPVTSKHLESVYNDLRRPYLPLPNSTHKRLAYVAKHYNVPLEEESDWAKVISDLAQKRVLLYLNGSEWYGIHPLLRNSISQPPVSS